MQGYELPHNLKATTSISEAIAGAQYAVHALPVQQTRTFLESIKVCLHLYHGSCLCSQTSLSFVELKRHPISPGLQVFIVFTQNWAPVQGLGTACC